MKKIKSYTPKFWWENKRDKLYQLKQEFDKNKVERYFLFREPRTSSDSENLIDIMQYLWLYMETEYGDFGLSYAGGMVLWLTEEIEQITGNKNKGLEFIADLSVRLDFHKSQWEWYRNQFEFYMRLALFTEVNLYVYQDRIDFDDYQSATLRKKNSSDDKKHIVISLNEIRDKMIVRKHSLYKEDLRSDLSREESQLIDKVRETSHEFWISVTANFKQWKLNKIQTKTRTVPGETKNLNDLKDQAYFGELEIKLEAWKGVYAEITNTIRFDKSQYLSNKEVLSKNGQDIQSEKQ